MASSAGNSRKGPGSKVPHAGAAGRWPLLGLALASASCVPVWESRSTGCCSTARLRRRRPSAWPRDRPGCLLAGLLANGRPLSAAAPRSTGCARSIALPRRSITKPPRRARTASAPSPRSSSTGSAIRPGRTASAASSIRARCGRAAAASSPSPATARWRVRPAAWPGRGRGGSPPRRWRARVFAPVGLSTHYHTHAVSPAWAPALPQDDRDRRAQFLQPCPAPVGARDAFNAAYSGSEPLPRPSMTLLRRSDIAAVLPPALRLPGTVAAPSPRRRAARHPRSANDLPGFDRARGISHLRPMARRRAGRDHRSLGRSCGQPAPTAAPGPGPGASPTSSRCAQGAARQLAERLGHRHRPGRPRAKSR